MKKFEYKQLKRTVDFEYLNELGNEGWELVAIQGDFYFLKREISVVSDKQLLNEIVKQGEHTGTIEETYHHEE